ncbi:polysaccharide deacetylase family protein [Bacillus sp. FJAT-45350]|uniref:polysaccharide deacetylase family protein n=1 Tax=Bacillus sp. FJAT-45350 TaxID=2011014 RepID=UPI000BB947EB|nr:polysaccharide deacetylase family protein [Bacillus sp. FJAT-45350]
MRQLLFTWNLEILREHDVKGTFYLTGHEIENYFKEAIQIVEEGHEIGNHSYSHTRMVFKSPSFIKDEIEPGSIILLHVMFESRRESLNSVSPMITTLQEQGYRFTTVSELLGYK